nr:lysine-rich arabinogalactan protein 19-like [Aegilops tauschii subsp. strangulata]
MAKFSEIIPYPFIDEEAASDEFARFHESGQCTKDEIAFDYKQEKSFVTGSIKDLVPLYDTMRHILRYTLTPKAGDSHNIWSSMLNVFVYLHQKKRVDVLDFMFYELRQCVQENKSLIYAPFIQALIESVCPAKYIASYKTSIPKRNSNWTPAGPTPYVPIKKGRNPRPEDRATFTPVSGNPKIPPRRAGRVRSGRTRMLRPDEIAAAPAANPVPPRHSAAPVPPRPGEPAAAPHGPAPPPASAASAPPARAAARRPARHRRSRRARLHPCPPAPLTAGALSARRLLSSPPRRRRSLLPSGESSGHRAPNPVEPELESPDRIWSTQG